MTAPTYPQVDVRDSSLSGARAWFARKGPLAAQRRPPSRGRLRELRPSLRRQSARRSPVRHRAHPGSDAARVRRGVDSDAKGRHGRAGRGELCLTYSGAAADSSLAAMPGLVCHLPTDTHALSGRAPASSATGTGTGAWPLPPVRIAAVFRWQAAECSWQVKGVAGCRRRLLEASTAAGPYRLAIGGVGDDAGAVACAGPSDGAGLPRAGGASPSRAGGSLTGRLSLSRSAPPLRSTPARSWPACRQSSAAQSSGRPCCR